MAGPLEDSGDVILASQRARGARRGPGPGRHKGLSRGQNGVRPLSSGRPPGKLTGLTGRAGRWAQACIEVAGVLGCGGSSRLVARAAAGDGLQENPSSSRADVIGRCGLQIGQSSGGAGRLELSGGSECGERCRGQERLRNQGQTLERGLARQVDSLVGAVGVAVVGRSRQNGSKVEQQGLQSKHSAAFETSSFFAFEN
jgi:hypothetical protein